MSPKAFEFTDHTLSIWTACDIDPFWDAMEQKTDTHPDVVDERMPYWAELWPSARLLAETILDDSVLLPEGPWLELGCGPGMAGVAASLRGITGTFTDYQEEALWLAGLNATENGVSSYATMLIDWRHPPEGVQVPWVLASDVAYETRNFEPLIRCVDTILPPGGEIWFAEPGRSITKPFFKQLKEKGWSVSTLKRQECVTVHRLQRR